MRLFNLQKKYCLKNHFFVPNLSSTNHKDDDGDGRGVALSELALIWLPYAVGKPP